MGASSRAGFGAAGTGKAWDLSAQPFGGHGEQGLEELEVVARALRRS
jgi:hypothetical protein